jgi:hypothetical protein
MVPYEAKLPVADRATLDRAVTKMLGVVEHLCLLLRFASVAPVICLRSAAAASPIDGDLKRRKRPPQSCAGKRSILKRDRENYTEVYGAFCRRLRRSARAAKRRPAHAGEPWTRVRPEGYAMPPVVEVYGFSSAENQEKSASSLRRPGDRKTAGSALERIRFCLAIFQLN